MYTIGIDYTTGNSFNTYRNQEDIGLVWEDKELARKALQSIKEHKNLIEELDQPSYYTKEKRGRKSVLEDIYSKPWYTNLEDSYKEYFKSCISCELDDGSFRHISAFWLGYFETLHSAAVITNEDDQDSISF